MVERISADMYRPILQFQLSIQVPSIENAQYLVRHLHLEHPGTIQRKVYIDAFPGNLLGKADVFPGFHQGSQVFKK